MTLISIILTSYKEEKTIGKAIQSILDNKLPKNYELLIMAPDEPTLDVARGFAKENKHIKIIKDPAEGKPNALNMAFKEAKGDILFLTDGDVYINKQAIHLMLEKFEDEKIGAVSGHPVPLNSKKQIIGFWGHLLYNVAHKRRIKALRLKKRMVCSGYLYAFRAGIFDSIPTETLSEDGYMSHLVYEAGHKISYSPHSEIYVEYPHTFKDWIMQKKRSVGGYNQIIMWIGKDIRSFSQETSGIFDVLSYPKTLRENFYTIALLFARLYLWVLIFINVNIKKQKLKKIWTRTDTTK